jgi:hypothetical protein
MYILNVKALLGQGHYSENGYVFNPLAPHVGPPFYPPANAALMLPAYAIWGFNLKALTGILTVYFVVALALAHAFFAQLSSRRIATLSLIAVAANPYVVGFASVVGSEFPFMLWLYGSLLLLVVRENASATIGLSALIGAFIFFSYETRDVGAILLVAVVIYDIVQGKNTLRRLAPMLFVFVIGLLWQRRLLPDSTGFSRIVLSEIVDVYRSGGHAIVWNLRNYAAAFRGFFPASTYVNILVTAASAIAMMTGAVLRVRSRFLAQRPEVPQSWILTALRSVPIELLFVLGTVLLLLSLPPDAEGGTRYFLPLFPILIWYGLLWLDAPALNVSGRAGFVVAVILVGYPLVHVASALSSDRNLGIADGPLSTPAQGAFAAVRTYAKPDDSIVVFSKPRAIALFSGSRSIAWPRDQSGRSIASFLSDERLKYVLLTRSGTNPAQPAVALDLVVRSGAVEVFSNTQFELFRLTNRSSPDTHR